MQASDLAKILNGSKYPFRLNQDICQEAKNAGLVIVYGASDDLMEFEGAIRDEVLVYGGNKVLIHKGGILGSRDDLDTDEEIQQWLDEKKNSKPIEATWCDGDYSWTYKTDIPHETFDIIEGDEKYCRGMVINLNDI